MAQVNFDINVPKATTIAMCLIINNLINPW